MDYVMVALAGFISGGFAVPVGFALGLNPIAVYLAATLGSVAGVALFVWSGDRLRRWIRRGRPDRTDVAASDRVERFRARGPRFLGIVGPTFPGVTASVVIGLASGFDRTQLTRWMLIGIAGLYAVYTAGLWLILR